MDKGKVLIDGDIVAYRAAFSTEKLSSKHAIKKAEELIEYILDQTVLFPSPDEYKVFLTGAGNFRHEISKSHVYKGNRSDSKKPIYLGIIRDYLVSKHGAIISKDEEADDLIAKEAARNNNNVIVASIDKDMLQIPCWHFNFNKKEWKKVSKWEGLKFFYTQILTGDRADNIVGLWKVGPVKASQLLQDCKTEIDLWKACLGAYGGNKDRVIENARLLWLRRKDNELWQPPKEEDTL
tara:strand:- start:2535 stop:3245 length:711 start_codon:yes stop_codon:yes gene_type:complete